MSSSMDTTPPSKQANHGSEPPQGIEPAPADPADYEPRAYCLEETASFYQLAKRRYVVSLIVGYDPAHVDSPREAGAAALRLTTDVGDSHSTRWCVYDRHNEEMYVFRQSELEG